MKKILFLFLVCLLSCSEDKEESGDLVSCEYLKKVQFNEERYSACVEYYINDLEKAGYSVSLIKMWCESEEDGVGKFSYNGCHNGYVKKCNEKHTSIFTNTKLAQVTYFYDSTLKDNTCEELLGSDD